ncbi:MAG: DUF4012 domain-containing protein [Acidimicrobiales bacterium]
MYEHRFQHPHHHLRYGFRHWYKHRYGIKHPHGSRAKTRSRRRREAAVVFAGAVGLLAAGAFVAHSALDSLDRARAPLQQARQLVDQLEDNPQQLLSAPGRAAAGRSIEAIERDAASARAILSSSRALDLIGPIPLLGAQRQGVLDLATDVGSVARIGSSLLDQLDAVTATSYGTSVDLPRLAVLVQSLQSDHAQLVQLQRPTSGLWGPVGAARADFDHEDALLTDQLARGQQILRYALGFLGASGPRTYLLAAENNAEMRDQGAVLSVAFMQAGGGTLHVSRATSIGQYPLSDPVAVPLPSGLRTVFGSFQPTQIWQSANVSADFPWSGTDLAAMSAAGAGQRVDGVVALDVPAVASLLALTGPVAVPGIPVPVTAANVAGILMHEAYAGAPAGIQAERRDENAAVASAVVDALTPRHVDVADLAHTLAADVAGRHLILWDAQPAREATLVRYGASGAIDAVAPTRAFHVAVENAGSNKLDYYVGVSVHQDVRVDNAGWATVDTAVTVDNQAPAGQPPSYQLGPDDKTSFISGQYVANVYLWGPRHSTQIGSVAESGLQVSQTSISLLAQHRTTVHFTTTIPDAVTDGHLSLTYVPQPRLQPITFTASVSAPNWSLQGPRTRAWSLTKTMPVTWQLSP